MRKIKNTALSLVFPIIFLIFWEYLARKIDNRAILPNISEILNILLHPFDELVGTGSLIENIGISLIRCLIAYIFSAIIAIPLGILLSTSKTLNKLLYDFINIFRPIPPLAWSPLVLAWFGIASIASIFNISVKSPNYVLWNSMRISMLFIIFTASFFVILANTVQGVSGIRQSYIDGAKVHGSTNFQIFKKILLPGAMPSILIGLRIGLSNAWLALVCAEMLPGSISGVGYMITHSYQLTRIDVVVAGIISISLVNFIIDGVFRYIDNKYFKWQSLAK